MNPKHEKRETHKFWKTRTHCVRFLSVTTKNGRQRQQERGRESDRSEKNAIAGDRSDKNAFAQAAVAP